jgi:hypothetical protein
VVTNKHFVHLCSNRQRCLAISHFFLIFVDFVFQHLASSNESVDILFHLLDVHKYQDCYPQLKIILSLKSSAIRSRLSKNFSLLVKIASLNLSDYLKDLLFPLLTSTFSEARKHEHIRVIAKKIQATGRTQQKFDPRQYFDAIRYSKLPIKRRDGYESKDEVLLRRQVNNRIKRRHRNDLKSMKKLIFIWYP